MRQPAAIWSSSLIVFDKEISLTQNVILTQGRSALRATIDRIDRLRALTRQGPVLNAAFDADIAPTLSDLCYQAGLVSTILFNDSPKGRLESEIAHQLRKERVQYVNGFCAERRVSPTTLIDRGVRNALTHVDERLADILTSEANIGWFIDVAVRARDEFVAPPGIAIRFCRSYVIGEDRILHLGQELDLVSLRAESIAVLAVVFGFDYGGVLMTHNPPL